MNLVSDSPHFADKIRHKVQDFSEETMVVYFKIETAQHHCAAPVSRLR